MGIHVKYLSEIPRDAEIYLIYMASPYGNTAERVIKAEFENIAEQIGGREKLIASLLRWDGAAQAEQKFRIKTEDLRPILVIIDVHPDDWSTRIPMIKLQLGRLENEDQVRAFLAQFTTHIAANDFGNVSWEQRFQRLNRIKSNFPIIIELIGSGKEALQAYKELESLHRPKVTEEVLTHFYDTFAEYLRSPVARRGEEGKHDPAIVALVEKINGMDRDFVLVDYGCGAGRLIVGLSLLDKKALAGMTYVGVDKNLTYLQEARNEATETGLTETAKACLFMLPSDFIMRDIRVDYLFSINSLHEIPLIELPTLLKAIEDKTVTRGHIVIHEMKEPEHEMGFVSWKETDFETVFKGTSFSPHYHAYETKRDHIPLFIVDAVKMTDKETRLVSYVDNLVSVYNNKKQETDKQIREIEKISTESNPTMFSVQRFGYFKILYHNIDRQIREYEEREPQLISSYYPNSTMVILPQITKCQICGSRRLKREICIDEAVHKNSLDKIHCRIECEVCGWNETVEELKNQYTDLHLNG